MLLKLQNARCNDEERKGEVSNIAEVSRNIPKDDLRNSHVYILRLEER